MPVIVTIRTGTCRYYENYDLAFLWLGRQHRRANEIYCGPNDFKQWGLRQREEIWPLFREWSWFRWKEDRIPNWNEFVFKTQEEQNKMLWVIVNNIADRVHVTPKIYATEETLQIDLDLCSRLLKEREWILIDVRAPQFPARMRKPAWQMEAIVQAFVENDEMYLTEDDLTVLVQSERMVRRMKTRQDPERIFRYYRPVLEAAGVIKR